MNSEFDPEKAFREIDQDRDGSITAYEIYRFMRNTLTVNVSLSEAETLVKEFDGNQDYRLSYSEFLQCVLPATSRAFRDLALNRSSIVSY